MLLGRPVVMLDYAQRIAGVGEYDPFGQWNRTSKKIESAHPYSTFGTLATIDQPAVAPLTTAMNVKFEMIDPSITSNSAFCGGGTVADKVVVSDGTNTNTWSVEEKGPYWTGYLAQDPSNTTVSIADGGCAMVGSSSCTCATGANPADGVVVEGYEYERYDSATTPYWTPIRLPGQYHDEESDLNQNWNRFYEPGSGRYLEPEPVWMSALPAVAAAYWGTQWPVYGYAANDPANLQDEDGRAPGDKRFGLPDRFWDWYHRKVKQKGDPDLEHDEAKEHHKEWKKQREPDGDGKCEEPKPPPIEIPIYPWFILPIPQLQRILHPPPRGHAPEDVTGPIAVAPTGPSPLP